MIFNKFIKKYKSFQSVKVLYDKYFKVYYKRGKIKEIEDTIKLQNIIMKKHRKKQHVVTAISRRRHYW